MAPPPTTGLNDYGQLGDRTTVRRTSPTRVFGTPRFRRISTGWGVTCAVTTDDAPFCWGLNTYGNLGDGTQTHRMQPTPVTGGHRFTEIRVGQDAPCGLNAGGAACCWGSNEVGQLGVGTGVQMETCVDPLNPHLGSFPCSLVPLAVVGGHAFSSITAGTFHACGLTSAASELYCWGLGLPFGSSNSTDPAPARVAPSYTFEKVVAAGSITCAIDAPSSAYCWGSGARARWGTERSTRTRPCRGSCPTSRQWTSTPTSGSARWRPTRARSAGGPTCTVPSATARRPNRTFATAVASSEKFTRAAASGRHTCGRTETGRVYCWGESSSGALGVGDFTQHLTPALARP